MWQAWGMTRTFCILMALAGSAGCVSAGGPRTVDYEGTSWRLVTGQQLRIAFVGNKIRYPDPQREGDIVLVSSTRCDAFFPDGRYVTCGDRVSRPTGTYEVRNDRICARMTRRLRCWQLFQSDTGRYLLGHPGEQPSVEPVSLVPVADSSAPPNNW
jgi:hypothetical protein